MDPDSRITRMNDIRNISMEPMPKSDYVKPFRLHFEQFGKKRFWDGVLTHSSVSCIIYNRTRRSLIFVKQFRPAVYMTMAQMMGNRSGNIDTIKFPISLGMTYELCSGIIDHVMSPEATMRKEIMEELGYDVQTKNLFRITGCRSGVGVTGSCSTYYYTEVDDSMKTSEGGGNPNEAEFIETVTVPLSELEQFMFDESRFKPPSLIFGCLWFLHYKVPRIGHSR